MTLYFLNLQLVIIVLSSAMELTNLGVSGQMVTSSHLPWNWQTDRRSSKGFGNSSDAEDRSASRTLKKAYLQQWMSIWLTWFTMSDISRGKYKVNPLYFATSEHTRKRQTPGTICPPAKPIPSRSYIQWVITLRRIPDCRINLIKASVYLGLGQALALKGGWPHLPYFMGQSIYVLQKWLSHMCT